MKRRHSFTSFLNVKFGKQAKKQEDKKVSNVAQDDSVAFVDQGKKGHRPRSYSE
jgi:hypothetical protein